MELTPRSGLSAEDRPAPSADELAAFQRAVAVALHEDLGPELEDLTAAALPEAEVAGAIVARAEGVLAGVDVASLTFSMIGDLLRDGWQHRRADGWPPLGDARFDVVRGDGTRLFPGDIIATVEGPAALVLAAERTALNFLQRMSGVATATRAYVDAVDGTGVAILDTRKTMPALRALDRFAVRCGGGHNHRFGLFDVAMVKDNHVDARGGIVPAVEQLRSVHPAAQVVVETRTVAEVRDALAARVDVILLDNMDVDLLRQAVAVVRSVDADGDRSPGAGLVTLEASGGITLRTIRAVAETGIDRISVGAITHSAPALDLALELQPLGLT